MQQLQSLYRGDSSPSLAQIFGMQYQPQNATSQMANTAVSSGMSAGAQVKTTAMNNATQVGIADANRQQANRHFTLTNALANRQQSEVERNNMATNEYNSGMLANNTTTTKWNTGGSAAAGVVQDDVAAGGEIAALTSQIDAMIGMLNPNDPNFEARKAQLTKRKQGIVDGFNNAKPGQKSAYIKSVMGMLNPAAGSTGVPGMLGREVSTGDVGRKTYPSAPAARGVPLTDAGKQVFNTPANSSGTYNLGGSNPISYEATDLGATGGTIQSGATSITPSSAGAGTMSLQELLNWKPAGAPTAPAPTAPAPAPAIYTPPASITGGPSPMSPDWKFNPRGLGLPNNTQGSGVLLNPQQPPVIQRKVDASNWNNV
jgi:hypothetical protein